MPRSLVLVVEVGSGYAVPEAPIPALAWTLIPFKEHCELNNWTRDDAATVPHRESWAKMGGDAKTPSHSPYEFNSSIMSTINLIFLVLNSSSHLPLQSSEIGSPILKHRRNYIL
jgi:hypothetical protein